MRFNKIWLINNFKINENAPVFTNKKDNPGIIFDFCNQYQHQEKKNAKVIK